MFAKLKKEGEKTMWISRKKWRNLEKRIAGLEREVQSQQETALYYEKLKRQEQKLSKRELRSRVNEMERVIANQGCMIELLKEFCISVANKEKLSLLTYQQLYSPSADSNEKVRVLFEKIRKFRKSPFNKDWMSS